MGDVVIYKFKFNTDAEILALTPEHPSWENLAFYYPNDRTWFYQAYEGVLKKYHGDPSEGGVGIFLNGKVIGGVKQYIEADDVLDVPANWEYNVTQIAVDGIINLDGDINIL